MLTPDERRLIVDTYTPHKFQLNWQQEERAFRSDPVFSQWNDLADSVELGQGLLRKYLTSYAILVNEPITDTEHAVLAATVQMLNLSRASLLLMCQGYAFQVGPLLRSVYEWLSLAYQVRINDRKAHKVLTNSIEDADIKGAAESLRKGTIALSREWALETGLPMPEPQTERELEVTLGKWYGTLCKFTHPLNTGNGIQFHTSQDIGALKFTLGPNTEAEGPLASFLAQLWYLQWLFGTLLILTTKSMPVDKHLEFQGAWAKYTDADMRLLQEVADLVPASNT